ncbi:MAG: carbon-nitrogen hydrolase [Deltaproteobacteria bacterium]|nr:carbon-nitrogen hydrolase [Deltaproteobacteria bacterium]
MKKLIAGIIQQKSAATPDANREKIAGAVTLAIKQGARLVVLQELHNTPYFCQNENAENFDFAEPVPGPSTNFFSDLAKDLGVVLVTSLFEKRAPGVYHNTAVVLENDGQIAGKYRKMHIPDDPGYYEKYYFTPGDLGFKPIETSIGKLGVLVCWDQWYPEAARLMALAGADLLIYPTAIGWEPTDGQDEKDHQLEAWTTIQRSHAIANGIPVISANRVGFEENPEKKGEGIDFWGGSFLADGQGKILARAGNHEEETVVAAIDLEQSEKLRRTWPFFRDRRIDAYKDLTKRFRD